MKNNCWKFYKCKKCGYEGDDVEPHYYYDEDIEEIIDETFSCPKCGEIEEFYQIRI